MTVVSLVAGVWSPIGLDIDPNVVKPGWTPLLITVALAGVMVLLYRSMRRQFGRIQMPPKDERSIPQADQDASEADDSEGAAGTSHPVERHPVERRTRSS